MNFKLTLKAGTFLAFTSLFFIEDIVGHLESYSYPEKYESEKKISTRRSKFTFANDCRSTNGIYQLGSNEILMAIIKLLTYWSADKILLVHDKNPRDLSNIVRTFEMNHIRMRYSTVAEADIVNARFIILMCDDEESSSKIFALETHSAITASMHTWMIVSASFPNYFHAEHFRKYAMSSNTQVTFLLPTPSHKHCGVVFDVEIFDVFYSQDTHAIERFRFATFVLPNLLMVTERTDIVRADVRPHGRTTRLYAFNLSPYVMIDEETNSIYGYLPEIYETIGTFLDVRYNLTISKDPTYGVEINRSFTGFIGKLQRSEHDIALTAVVITQERKRVVYFTIAIIRSYMTLFMKNPGSKVPPTIYFLPFTGQVWLCLFLGCTTYLAVLWIVAIVRVAPTIRSTVDDNYSRKTLQLVLWQSVKHIGELISSPSGLSAKIFCGIFFWAGMMVFSYYSSVFTSFLTYRESKLPITTLDELASNRAYEILIVNQTMHWEIFKRAKDHVQVQIWKRIVAQGASALANGFNEGYYKMFSGKYVYLSDGPSTNYLSRGNCQVGHSSAKYFRYFYHMTLRKDFPYNNLFSSCILKLMEGGILSRLQRLHFSSNRDACSEESTTHSIELNQSATIFVLLLSFLIISLFALLIEIAVYRRQRRRARFGGAATVKH